MRRWLVVIWVAAASCQNLEIEAPKGALPVHVEWVGCKVVHRGPVCELDEDRRLTIWVDYPGRLRLTASPGLKFERQDAQNGQRFVMTLAAKASNLVVTSTAGHQWRLPLRASESDSAIEAANRLARKKRFDEARLRFEAISSDRPRAHALALLGQGKIARMQGREDDALTLLRRAVDAFHRQGLYSREASARIVLATMHKARLEWTESRGWLALDAPCFVQDPYAAAKAHYHLALVQRDAGHFRAALHHVSEARQTAQRLADSNLFPDATLVFASILQQLGRSAQVTELLQPLLQEPLGACDFGHVYQDLGWHALSRGEAGAPVHVDPMLLIDRAIEAYQKSPLPRCRRKLSENWLNRALAQLQAGRPTEALHDLANARKQGTPLSPRLELWAQDIEGRSYLALGQNARARRVYGALSKIAQISNKPDDRWRAAVGQGRVYQAAGDFEGALEKYQEAEAVLDEGTTMVALGDGVGSFIAARRHSAMRLIDRQLAAHRDQDALQAIRVARTRPLRHWLRQERLNGLSEVDQRRWESALRRFRRLSRRLSRDQDQDWQWTQAQLQASQAERQRLRQQMDAALQQMLSVLSLPRSDSGAFADPRLNDELLLAFHPLPDGQWAAIGALGDRIHTKRMKGWPASMEPSVLAPFFLGSFEALIDRAPRIRILATGRAREVDVHALPYRGQPLIAHRPVMYPLELGTQAKASAGQRALVVVDPRGNLAAARREGRFVHRRLQQLGWKTEMLQGRQASLFKVRAQLGDADMFHFAGHGAFEGLDGLRSALRLAGSDELTAAEVLTLPRVPPVVVLASCESEAPGRRRGTAEFGLARAFVVAGSQMVFATTRPIQDDEAAQFVKRLYADDTPHRRLTPEDMQRAQVALMTHAPRADWAAFRLYVR